VQLGKNGRKRQTIGNYSQTMSPEPEETRCTCSEGIRDGLRKRWLSLAGWQQKHSQDFPLLFILKAQLEDVTLNMCRTVAMLSFLQLY